MQALDFTTKLGQIAREIQRVSSNGQDADLDSLQERLGEKLSRKNIADCASKLHRLGYAERLGFGKYRATDKLSQLVGKESEESLEQAEDAEKQPAVIFRKQSREQAERAAKKRQEAELSRLGSLVDRLEDCPGRLEKATERLAYNYELQEAMGLLEQAWTKRKKICAADSASGQSQGK